MPTLPPVLSGARPSASEIATLGRPGPTRATRADAVSAPDTHFADLMERELTSSRNGSPAPPDASDAPDAPDAAAATDRALVMPERATTPGTTTPGTAAPTHRRSVAPVRAEPVPGTSGDRQEDAAGAPAGPPVAGAGAGATSPLAAGLQAVTAAAAQVTPVATAPVTAGQAQASPTTTRDQAPGGVPTLTGVGPGRQAASPAAVVPAATTAGDTTSATPPSATPATVTAAPAATPRGAVVGTGRATATDAVATAATKGSDRRQPAVPGSAAPAARVTTGRPAATTTGPAPDGGALVAALAATVSGLVPTLPGGTASATAPSLQRLGLTPAPAAAAVVTERTSTDRAERTPRLDPASPAVTRIDPAVPTVGLSTPAAVPTGPTGPTVAPSAAPRGPDLSSAHHVVATQVLPEVARLVGSGEGVHRLVLQLNPRALGEVRVVLTLRQGDVHVRFAAGDQARAALLSSSSDLHRLLEQAGAQSARVDVRDPSGNPTGSSSSWSSPTAQNSTASDGAGGFTPGGQATTDHHHPGTGGGPIAMDGIDSRDRTVRGASRHLGGHPIDRARTSGVDLTM
ncbi:flagellar hook-length control protein FliK [Dermatophilaceae bacterium Soc4.6]